MKITETIAGHMVAVYRAMDEEAKVEENHKIYVGRLSRLVTDLGISMTYYSKIFRALYEGGYAALEDRGGRNKPSTVILLREPKINELTALTLTHPGPILSLVKRVDAVEKSLGGVYVVGVLNEMQKRLELLEDQVATKKGK